MEVSWENPSAAIWSPDGAAFTYVAGQPGDRRVFVRYLNSPTPLILTHDPRDWSVAGWSPDGKHVVAKAANPAGSNTTALFSIPVFGGDPVPIMTLETPRLILRVSPDGKALAAVGYDNNSKLSVYTASPVGAPLEAYAPAPFETVGSFNTPMAAFDPDGRSLTLIVDVVGGRQAWRLPYPAGKEAPRRILANLTTLGDTPRWAWFPDGRNGFLSSTDDRGEHLWLAGIHSGPRQRVMTGISSEAESQPALSPDGKQLLFRKSRADSMIVSASLSDATVQRQISSEVNTGMPAWALHQQEFVYDSGRNGAPGIWMRGDGWDRPIVTPQSFPAGTTNGFVTPTLSPGADRVVYGRIDNQQRYHIWISSVSGGPPVRLTNEKDAVERGGAWSPDGTSVVYWDYRDGIASLMLAKTTGEAAPVVLRQRVADPLPDWSRDGQWISFLTFDKDGLYWSIISPDGKTERRIGEPHTLQMAFSADSKRLYGIRSEADRCVLYSIDMASKEEKTIGSISKDFSPSSYSNPGIRLSLAPDGKSILYPTIRRSSSLWMLEGFDQPGWLDWLREAL
jgi:Tol biopolymer transport system component